MITISLLGLDPFISQQVSASIMKPLCQALGCSKDEIMVFAPEGFLFHGADDQTDYHVLARVSAPKRYMAQQDKAATAITSGLQRHAIHVAVEFSYFEDKDRYEAFSADYPRFLNDANTVEAKAGDPKRVTDVYQGDVFSEKNLVKTKK